MTSENIENNSQHLFPSDLKERYLDARPIGAGGMGIVFSAHDSRLDKRIAIKLLPPNNENAKAVIRFQQEARAVSKLNNKHIVQVLDFGFTDDQEPFLVMELIDGKDLLSLVEKTGPLPITTVVEIAIQVCSGLEHAHANGVIHRDLKPGNIMLDANDCVRILDFGLAKIVTQTGEDGNLTKPGTPLGSILYMSPEQFVGSQADERTDVYAVGLLIYHMMAGYVPHEKENMMKMIHRRREEAPPELPHSDDTPLMSDCLNKIVKTALAINPDDRFPSMSRFKEELHNCLAIQSEEKSVSSTGVNQTQQKKSLRIPVLILFSTLILGSVFVLIFARAQTPVGPDDKTDDIKRITQSSGITLPPGFRLEPDAGVDWWLADSDLPDSGMNKLKNSGVKSLSLMANKVITDNAIFRVRGIDTIVALSLRDTKLTDGCIDDLNKMKLTALNIRSTQITEEGVMRLARNADLRGLDVKYLKLTNAALKHIVDSFPNLRSLNIGDTQITGEGLRLLSGLKELTQLYAAQLNLNDKDVDPLFSLNLDALELAANPITHITVEKILKMKTLRTLLLTGCTRLTPNDVERLTAKFPDAEITTRLPAPVPEFFEIYEKEE